MAKLRNINLTLWIGLITIFLYLAADWIYGPFAAMVTKVLTVYLILLIGMVTFTGAQLKLMPNVQSAMPFAVGFFITFIALFFLRPTMGGNLLLGQVENIKIAAGFGLLHGLVKAYIEEVVFRWILPFIAGLGPIMSNVLFGFFHAGVLMVQGELIAIPAMLLLMVLGFAWHILAWKIQIFGKPLGILGSAGSHYAYNLFALGAL